MNTTAKTYFSLALFAGLLYPIMWRVITPEGFAIMFGGSWLSAAFTIGATAISAVAGIYLVGFLTVSANPSIFAGMVVRLGGFGGRGGSLRFRYLPYVGGRSGDVGRHELLRGRASVHAGLHLHVCRVLADEPARAVYHPALRSVRVNVKI